MTDEERRYKNRIRMRKYLERHRDDEQFMARKCENNRKWIAANRERLNAKMRQWCAEHPEIIRERNRRYYAAHKAEENERCRKYRAAHHDEISAKKKIRYREVMADPELYSKRRDRENAWWEKHRDEINAKRREWNRNHKRKLKMRGRLQRDRRKMLFRDSPELYAAFRDKRRVYEANRRRVRGLVRSVYIPRPSCRIPDTCSYGRVLDTRSVFLWNNLPSASLKAGRAYKMMQWCEIHCDRFGRVCR